MHNHFYNVAVPCSSAEGKLNSLQGSEPVFDKLLQIILKINIAVKTQLRCKTDNCGFACSDGCTKLCGSHKCCFIITFDDKIGNFLLPFAECRIKFFYVFYYITHFIGYPPEIHIGFLATKNTFSAFLAGASKVKSSKTATSSKPHFFSNRERNADV